MQIFQSPFPDITIPDISVTEWVFERLASHKDKVLLADSASSRTITADQAVEQVRALAGGLVARGLQKGQVVAIMAPNLPDYFIVFHGVALAGGTLTVINPTYTAAELRFQLQDSAAQLLITVPGLLATARDAIEDTGVKQIVTIGEVDSDVMPLSGLMGAPLEQQVPVDPTSDVVVLPYSSGTTGLPKGVMLTHRNLVANACQWIEINRIECVETTPIFLPFFHIFGLTLGLMVYPGAGAGIVTMPRFDLEQLLKIIQDTKAQRLWIAPPVAIALAKHPLVDQFDLSSLGRILSGAAPLGADIGEALAKRLDCDVVQGFGMTELSPVSHCMPMDEAKSGSVGVTVANTCSRIVEPDSLNDCAPGEAGELWVKGPQVMKGYLNNPAETAKVLDSDGWFRTGDIASIDAQGHLYIHDRLKEMIKVKGFAVAPAEVEAALVAHPAILDAAVIGVPNNEFGEVPKAYIVPVEDSAPDLSELQQYLGSRLARYKIVHELEVVEAIPKSASGKILRRILRDRAIAEV